MTYLDFSIKEIWKISFGVGNETAVDVLCGYVHISFRLTREAPARRWWYILREASALSVQLRRAIPEPQIAERTANKNPRAFFARSQGGGDRQAFSVDWNVMLVPECRVIAACVFHRYHILFHFTMMLRAAASCFCHEKTFYQTANLLFGECAIDTVVRGHPSTGQS